MTKPGTKTARFQSAPSQRTQFGERNQSHLGHGVGAVLGFQFRHGDDVAAVRGELAAQKQVQEVDLTDDVDEVEHLAQEEPAKGVVILT